VRGPRGAAARSRHARDDVGVGHRVNELKRIRRAIAARIRVAIDVRVDLSFGGAHRISKRFRDATRVGEPVAVAADGNRQRDCDAAADGVCGSVAAPERVGKRECDTADAERVRVRVGFCACYALTGGLFVARALCDGRAADADGKRIRLARRDDFAVLERERERVAWSDSAADGDGRQRDRVSRSERVGLAVNKCRYDAGRVCDSA